MRHVLNVLSLLISPILDQSFDICLNSLCRDLVETFKIIYQTKIRPCDAVFGEKGGGAHPLHPPPRSAPACFYETYERYRNNVRI